MQASAETQKKYAAAGAAIATSAMNGTQHLEPDADVQRLWQEAQAAMLDCDHSEATQHQRPDQAPPEAPHDAPSTSTAHSCTSADHAVRADRAMQQSRHRLRTAYGQQAAQQIRPLPGIAQDEQAAPSDAPVHSMPQHQQTAQHVTPAHTTAQHQQAAPVTQHSNKRQQVQGGDTFGRALQRFGSCVSQGTTQRAGGTRSVQPMVGETTLNMLQVSHDSSSILAVLAVTRKRKVYSVRRFNHAVSHG